MSRETELDKIAKASEQAYHEQQAIIFAEQAAGRLAEADGANTPISGGVETFLVTTQAP